MSVSRPSLGAGHGLLALVLLVALATPTGQGLLTAAASRIGRLYAATITAANTAPATPVTATPPERSK